MWGYGYIDALLTTVLNLGSTAQQIQSWWSMGNYSTDSRTKSHVQVHLTHSPTDLSAMFKYTWLTYWFVCHAHISRSPSTKSTGQVVGFLHGGFGWVIWKLCGDACCPGGKSMHAPRAVKAVGTSVTWQTQLFIQLILIKYLLSARHWFSSRSFKLFLLLSSFTGEVFHIISSTYCCKTGTQNIYC